MQNRDNIEKLFKDSFQNFEADVNPNVWTTVQNGIASSAGSATGAAAGAAAGTAAKFALGKIIAGTLAIAGLAGSIWYFAADNNSKTNAAASSSQNKTEVIVQETSKNILAQNKSEEIVSTAPSNKQPAASDNSSNNKVADNSQQTQNISDASSNTQSAENPPASDNSAPSSAPPAKYGNASQDDRAKVMMRHNNIPADNSASSTNSSSEETTVAYESYPDASDEPDTDQNRIPEVKPVSGIGNIPNIFTPNGDGENDVFFFQMKNITTIGVAILSKSGDLVAKWNTLEGGWNGKTFTGMDAAEGVYYYSIHARGADGMEYSKNGFITLER